MLKLKIQFMNITKNDLLFYSGLLSAVWFACLGMFWPYYIALFIAYPVGILSYVLWRNVKHENRERTKFIPIILTLGLLLSLSALIVLLIKN